MSRRCGVTITRTASIVLAVSGLAACAAEGGSSAEPPSSALRTEVDDLGQGADSVGIEGVSEQTAAVALQELASDAPNTVMVTATRSFSGPAGNNVIANCPAGSVVVGGGFAGTNQDVLVSASRKSGNGWETVGYNRVTPIRTLTAYAICLSGTNGTTSEATSNTLTVAANGTMCTSVPCSSGLLTCGGFEFSSPNMTVYMAYVTDNARQLTCVRNPTSQSQTVKVRAVCLSGVNGSIRVWQDSTIIPALSTASGDASCGIGLLLSGGLFADQKVAWTAGRRETVRPTYWDNFVYNSLTTTTWLTSKATCIAIY